MLFMGVVITAERLKEVIFAIFLFRKKKIFPLSGLMPAADTINLMLLMVKLGFKCILFLNYIYLFVFAACICSVHFLSSAFFKSVKQDILNYQQKNFRNLKKDAIPTEFLPNDNQSDTHRRFQRRNAIKTQKATIDVIMEKNTEASNKIADKIEVAIYQEDVMQQGDAIHQEDAIQQQQASNSKSDM